MTVFVILHLFLIGFVSGLRSMTAPAVLSWAVFLGRMDLSTTPLAFLGYSGTRYILTLLAIGELVVDKLPTTPSRKAPVGFSGRIITGTFSGWALALAVGWPGLAGGALGCIGAIAGTLGGYEARTRLVRAFRAPLAIALFEDALAIALAFFVARA